MSVDSSGAVPSAIREVLDTHHDLTHREVARLQRALPAGGASRQVQIQWRRLAQLLEHHLMREEVQVFPGIEALIEGVDPPIGALRAAVQQLIAEHRQIDAIDDALRPLLPEAGAEAAAVEALLDDLRAHAALEEEHIFPALNTLQG